MEENGLNQDRSQMDRTIWGNVPKLLPLTNAFTSDQDRPYEDVGFDGMRDQEERDSLQPFLTACQSFLTPAAFAKLQNDPSSDNYVFFDDASYGSDPNILDRYKNFNGPDGNTPIQTGTVSSAGSSLPDGEDLNKDNTLNEDEEYFQYRVDMKPGMDVGTNKYIITKQNSNKNAANGQAENWYEFRIPIHDFDNQVGTLPDFKSIQFMRVFATGWSDTAVVLRFATLDLIRNQWRAYDYPIDPGSDFLPSDNNGSTYFNVGKVDIEENSAKAPVNYILPPGIDRTYAIGAQTNQYVQQNEQSLSLTVCGLEDGNSKAVFKNVGLDLRRYYHLDMFVHANRVVGAAPIKDNDVTAFVRIGSDFTDNYYQYEIPLHVLAGANEKTTFSSDVAADRDSVWPVANNVDIDLQYIVDLKIQRNVKNWPKTVPYRAYVNGRIYTIVGEPDLGGVKDIMLGIKNPQKGDTAYHNPYDDGASKCAEVWFDELRLSGLNEHGGTAALGEVAVKMADLGRINLTGSMHTAGFGQIEQKIDQRYKDDLYQYSASGTFELGKLFPVKAGIRLPFYGSIAQSFSLPEYDPYQTDILTSQELRLYNKDSAALYKKQIETTSTRRGFNFSGVRIMPKLKSKRQRIYDPANFTFTYSYNEIISTDPYTELNFRKTHIGIINWSFSPQAKEFSPFKKLIKIKTKWLDIIKDFNFNLMPATLSFNTDINRDFNSIKLRDLGDVGGDLVPTTYNKSFKWNRVYAFKYNPFKSLSLDYSANNQARIDEYEGAEDTREKRDFMWKNFENGGRNVNYAQSFATTYTLPLNKIPLFDFVASNVGYASTYTWVASPEVFDSATNFYKANPLGNTISNTQNLRGKVDLNFKKIYDKVPFLKTYNTPNPNLGDKKENDKKREAIRNARQKIMEDITKLKEKKEKLEGDLDKIAADQAMPDSIKAQKTAAIKKEIKSLKKQIRQKHKDYRAKQMPPDPFISVIMRPLLSLKTASAEYRENKGTTMAGFLPSTNLLGVNNQLAAPGYGFAFGGQPGDRLFGDINTTASDKWLDRAAAKGWVSSDTFLNSRFIQTKSIRLDLKASFEIMPDLKVDLSLFKETAENQSELFKVVSEGDGWQHLTPMVIGSYTISYVPIQTFFKPIDQQGFSQTYNTFLSNRSIISKRLGVANPNTAANGTTWLDPTDSTGRTRNSNYAAGYGPKQQDVLIAAFLAAYNHKNANNVNLDPFKSMPVPNWRLTYNGLTKIKWMKKIFTNFTLSHGYSSTLTVSSYSSNLDATKDSKGNLNRIDSLSNNYYSNLNMPSIVINEQFSPLIGIDATLTNKVSFRFDYKTSRTLTMSFSDYQLIENKSTTITAGAGYTIKGLKIKFIKMKNGKPLRLDNDLKFKVDVSYRDGITINHRIDETQPEITAGSNTLTISPAIDYMITKNISLRMFCDYSHTNPRVLSSFPTTNIKGGFQLRMSLTQ
jgi:cell surface protein SprA